jgi:hypothetical protein
VAFVARAHKKSIVAVLVVCVNETLDETKVASPVVELSKVPRGGHHKSTGWRTENPKM